MSAQLGLTTVGGDKFFNWLRGTSLIIPVIQLLLHDGPPGIGASNIFAGADPESILFANSSGGVMSMTGTPPIFLITDDTDVDSPVGYASAHAGLVGYVGTWCFATGAFSIAQDLVEGDQLSFASVIAQWTMLASV